MNRDLSNIRKDFTKESLHAEELNNSPIIQFKQWLNEAIDKKELEPTAMTLSTVSADGIPSARIVLLKKLAENGEYWFYTNYNSNKGTDLKNNNHAALNFFWPGLERQIRITGTVEKISSLQSDIYFQSRPLDSQLSAIASPQSEVIKSRTELENRFDDSRTMEIKRPENWGGYALTPHEIEFWQGRAGRLHDRIRYQLKAENWIKERLAP